MRNDWLERINAAVCESDPHVILVAHSLGCNAVVGWATGANAASSRRVAGAFLVAPADTDRDGVPKALHAWRPVPLAKLPFPSVVIASRNDEWSSFERSKLFAKIWGSRFVDMGKAGHINALVGYGPWPEGHRLLIDFTTTILSDH